MKYLSAIVLFLIGWHPSYSQDRSAVWIFGDSSGIDFRDTSNTKAINTKVSIDNSNTEAWASISSANGDLLFYIDVMHFETTPIDNYYFIRNNKGVLINGDSIECAQTALQGAIILPSPDNKDYYYLFTLQYHGTPVVSALYYSVIHMLNDSVGEVVKKNKLLSKCDTLDKICISERMDAVKHANGKDWWLFLQAVDSTNNIIRYLLTNDGIKGPFSQQIGPIIGPIMDCGTGGMMKFSPEGNRLLIVNWKGAIDLYDVDRCSGLLFNWVDITPSANNCVANSNVKRFWGCSFSPNGKLCYISTYKELYQLNITSQNIASSAVLLFTNPNNGMVYGAIWQHQLAPNGRIFITITSNSNYQPFKDSIYTHLTVISNPNGNGLSCNVQPYSFSLKGRRTYGGLPNMPNYNLAPLPSYQADAGQDTTLCAGTALRLGKPAIDSLTYLWRSSADTAWQSTEAQPPVAPRTTTAYYLLIDDTAGTYSCALRWDTVVVTVSPQPQAGIQATPTAICPGDTVDLQASGGVAYSWHPGTFLSDSTSSQPTAILDSAITYTVVVTDSLGCRDTASVRIDALPKDSCVVGVISYKSLGMSVRVWPNPAGELLRIEYKDPHTATLQIWSIDGRTIHNPTALPTGGLTLDVSRWASGLYFVQVVSDKGVWVEKVVVR